MDHRFPGNLAGEETFGQVTQVGQSAFCISMGLEPTAGDEIDEHLQPG